MPNFICFIFSSLCFCGIFCFLDSPEHLLTVILAPGSADTDCQRDVSFLLFISSYPERCCRTQVSLFSLEAEGGGGLGVGGRVLAKTVGGEGGGSGDGGVVRHAMLNCHLCFLAIRLPISRTFFSHLFKFLFAPAQP